MAASEEALGNDPSVEIRILDDHAEFQATLEVQRKVWVFSETDCVPPRLSIVAQEIGGLVIGAFAGDQMIGYSLTFPGVKSGGRPFWHSHMTGVLPEYQGRGIGRRLKLRQREEAVRAGIDLVEWTFDPLEIRNAHFNIERLGVIIRRFLPNQYGITSSKLHGGLPTDRLVAEWNVVSEHVEQVIEGDPRPPVDIQQTIEVPAEIAQLREKDPKAARQIQTRVRQQFQESFGKGLTVVGYTVTDKSGEFELAMV